MSREQNEAIRLAVLERIVGSLIYTHPDPSALLRSIEKVALASEAQFLHFTEMSDQAVSHAQTVAQEWVGLTEDAIARREPSKMP